MGKQADIKFISRLTIITTFLMGFLDAFTFVKYDGTFVSAQTGNMVTMSVKLFSGNFTGAASHLIVLGGYALGAFIGEALIEKLMTKELYRSRLILLFQTLLIGVLALSQNNLPGSLMIFSLGLLAGYEITVFRTFYQTTVNNGIMTGNTKNTMNNLYKTIFNKDKKAQADFFHLLTVILVFIIGAGSGALILKMNGQLVLWIAFASMALITLYTTIKSERQ